MAVTDELNRLEWALLGLYVRVSAWVFRAGRFRLLLFPLTYLPYWLCLLTVIAFGHQGAMVRWWDGALADRPVSAARGETNQ